MTKEEIALQLTLKALEYKAIGLATFPSTYRPKEDDPHKDDNMRAICSAYNTALKELNLEK